MQELMDILGEKYGINIDTIGVEGLDLYSLYVPAH
jgi:hypothetical protein